MPFDQIHGVGVGLRWSMLDDVLEGGADGRVRFFEISPENYMRRGGHLPLALDQVSERFPIVSHGLSMSLGSSEPFDPGYMRALSSLLRGLRAPWHSDHLSFSAVDGVNLHDLLPIPFSRATVDLVVDRVRRAQDVLGIPMAVENVSYYAQLDRPEMPEPEFISQVVERAQCGLLLDVNNIYVNSINHRFDPWSCLAEMPLHRVVEVHVAGPEDPALGVLLDTHGAAVRSEVYDMLAWVIEQTGPKPVLLERDHNIPPLAELLEEVDLVDAVYQRAVRAHQARVGGRHAA